VLVGTSPSRSENEGLGLEGAELGDPAPQLFEPPVGERRQRRLSKAESLAYVRTIRARLHRADSAGPTPISNRRVA
jgi:hypothetical protein